ncbi:MAG: helix-turn-helix transcriptional regulator [Roseivirga sp.]|nr:helix-turn-helix transcriptional regulator [Roseivirga sp.]
MKFTSNHSIERVSSEMSESIRSCDLSDREVEILKLVVLQYSNAEISERINLSRNTVKFHLKSIFQKLQVSTRQEAARLVLST